MTRIKRWLVERFLPAYACEALLEEVKKLENQVARQAATIREQEAYIQGVTAAMRAQRRVTIHNGGGV